MRERATSLGKLLRVRGPSAHRVGADSEAVLVTTPEPGMRTAPELGAVLDEEHVGDIEGAFGTIHLEDTGARRSWKAKLLTLAAIVGPGLIVMVGDNDAGGVATYA